TCALPIFAVEVRREVHGVGGLRRLRDGVDLLASILGDHVLGREAVLDVDPELALAGVLGEVADVTVGGQDTVIGAEVALDRPRLGRRLDDHQVLRHSAGSIATGPCTAGSGPITAGSPAARLPATGAGNSFAQASRTRRRKSSS